ncbi:hypothetical protein D3C78_1606830 [compost metagenome]
MVAWAAERMGGGVVNGGATEERGLLRLSENSLGMAPASEWNIRSESSFVEYSNVPILAR